MYSIEEVRKVDPEIAAAIEQEVKRQNEKQTEARAGCHG